LLLRVFVALRMGVEYVVICRPYRDLVTLLWHTQGLRPGAKFSAAPRLEAHGPGLHLRQIAAKLVLALEAVASFAIGRHRFNYFQKCPGGVRKVRVFAVDEA